MSLASARRGYREQYDHPSTSCLLPYYPDLTFRVYPFRLDRLAVPPGWQPDLIYLASPASVHPRVAQLSDRPFRPQRDRPPTPLGPWCRRAPGPRPGNPFVIHPSTPSSIHARDIGRYLEGTGCRATGCPLGRGVDTACFIPSVGRCLPPPAGAKRRNHPGLRLSPGLGERFDSWSGGRPARGGSLPFKLLIVGEPQSRCEGRPATTVRAREGSRCLHRILDRRNRWRVPMLSEICFALFHHETFGLVVPEAMASGVPGSPAIAVVHQTLCATKDGLLEDPNDVNRFVQCILQVSSDRTAPPALYRARQFAEDTTWEKINRRVARQLADALKERRRQRQRQPQRKLLHTTAAQTRCSEQI